MLWDEAKNDEVLQTNLTIYFSFWQILCDEILGIFPVAIPYPYFPYPYTLSPLSLFLAAFGHARKSFNLCCAGWLRWLFFAKSFRFTYIIRGCIHEVSFFTRPGGCRLHGSSNVGASCVDLPVAPDCTMCDRDVHDPTTLRDVCVLPRINLLH